MNDLTSLVNLLLKKNELQVDQQELSFQLQSHPSYPSLHAIGGVLDHFHVDHVAVQVPAHIETIEQLPDCFMAQVKSSQGEEMAVIERQPDGYTIRSTDGKQKWTKTEFIERFTGIVIAVERKSSFKADKRSGRLLDRVLAIAAVLLLITLFVFRGISWSEGLFLITSLLGCYVSHAIKQQEEGIQTRLGQAFCDESQASSSCAAVIHSKGGLLFGRLKLSSMSSVYFIGFSLATTLFILLGHTMSLLLILSIVAFPITIYSLYYQKFVIKQWCLLCLGIVALLIGQFVLSLFQMDKEAVFSFDFSEVVTLLFGFLLAFTGFRTVGQALKHIRVLELDKVRFFYFKRNFSLFQFLLQKSPQLNTKIQGLKELSFGNVDAPLEITVVSNPFCSHCKKVHNLVETLLNRYPEHIRLNIRFLVALHNPKSPGITISARLIELYQYFGPDTSLEAMHDIYNGLPETEWLKKWGQTEDYQAAVKSLELMSEWSTGNQINFTPEVLVNGRAYPREYEREDLVYFIEELHEGAVAGRRRAMAL